MVNVTRIITIMSKSNIQNLCKQALKDSGDKWQFSEEMKDCLHQFLSQVLVPTLLETLEKTGELEGKHRVTTEMVKRSAVVMHGPERAEEVSAYIDKALETYSINRSRLCKPADDKNGRKGKGNELDREVEERTQDEDELVAQGKVKETSNDNDDDDEKEASSSSKEPNKTDTATAITSKKDEIDKILKLVQFKTNSASTDEAESDASIEGADLSVGSDDACSY